MILSRGIQTAIFNLVLVGILGCFLRFLLLQAIPGINYSYIIHAHSHLAFLGWVFMALFALLVYNFLSFEKQENLKYKALFVIFQTVNFGMLFTFPIMGYALWSIVFSALHALAAIYFAFVFYNDLKLTQRKKHKFSYLVITWALILMVVSNFAPFFLGPVSAVQGKSDLYYLLIYFYLHFQYNGWFTLALIALIFRLLETLGLSTNHHLLRLGFTLKISGLIPAYLLSTLWTNPHWALYLIAGISALVQLVGISILFYFVIKHIKLLFHDSAVAARILFAIGSLAVLIQHVLQVLSSLPSLLDLYISRNIVISYLHLVLIGFVSTWIFFLIYRLNCFDMGRWLKLGLTLFISAFIFTEFILLFQKMIDNSAILLFVLALIQVLGIIVIFTRVKKHIPSPQP